MGEVDRSDVTASVPDMRQQVRHADCMKLACGRRKACITAPCSQPLQACEPLLT